MWIKNVFINSKQRGKVSSETRNGSIFCDTENPGLGTEARLYMHRPCAPLAIK